MNRHRRGFTLIITLLTLCTVGINSQEVDESLALLLEGALTVHINARIIDKNVNEAVWNMELTRITILGTAVEVRLEGRNIVVEAEFTPYQETEDELILIAEGRTWVTGGNSDDVQYRTSFTTLPIRLGESVLFLPLGSSNVPLDTEQFGRLNIELEINVDQYQS